MHVLFAISLAAPAHQSRVSFSLGESRAQFSGLILFRAACCSTQKRLLLLNHFFIDSLPVKYLLALLRRNFQVERQALLASNFNLTVDTRLTGERIVCRLRDQAAIIFDESSQLCARHDEDAELSSLSVSEFVRRRSLGRPVLAKADAVVIRELRRLGGLVKHLHVDSKGAYSRDTAAALGTLSAYIERLSGGRKKG